MEGLVGGPTVSVPERLWVSLEVDSVVVVVVPSSSVVVAVISELELKSDVISEVVFPGAYCSPILSAVCLNLP